MDAGRNHVLRAGSGSPLPVGIESEPLIVKTPGTLNSTFAGN